jgi:hypothetical protein
MTLIMAAILMVSSYVAGNTVGYEQGMKESKTIENEINKMFKKGGR